MAKKKQGTAASEIATAAPAKQTYFEGTEPIVIEAIEKALEKYEEHKSARLIALGKEVVAKETLVALLKEHASELDVDDEHYTYRSYELGKSVSLCHKDTLSVKKTKLDVDE
jgi:hypothetical protein